MTKQMNFELGSRIKKDVFSFFPMRQDKENHVGSNTKSNLRPSASAI